MRRLAPLFISAAVVAFTGTAYAGGDKHKTTAAGTDNTTLATTTDTTVRSSGATVNGSTDTTAQAPAGEGRKDLTEELNKEDKDKAAKKKVTNAKTKDKNKAKKETVASTSGTANGSMGANGSTMPDAKPSPASDSPPLSATQGEKANSMTGKSAGQ